MHECSAHEDGAGGSPSEGQCCTALNAARTNVLTGTEDSGVALPPSSVE